MTQTLDVNERVSDLSRSQPASTPASHTAATPATVSKFGTFAITYGIAFAILYTVFEQFNWPLFTFHPAVGKVDFWMQRPRSGEGPPMYWYGWLALSFPTAAVVAWIATLVPSKSLYRATLFCCALAALWPAALLLGTFIADKASFNADFLKSVWVAVVPALVIAGAISYLAPMQWVQRIWTSWLLIMPIGGLLVLTYSLKTFFLR
jgi:hypothetical protein